METLTFSDKEDLSLGFSISLRSALCGLSPSIGVPHRLQDASGAGLFAFMAISCHPHHGLSEKERVRCCDHWLYCSVGFLTGPLLEASWSNISAGGSIFFINLPIGAIWGHLS